MKILRCLVCCIFVFMLLLSITDSAVAGLEPSPFYVTDTDTSLMWLRDANLAATEKFEVSGINSNGSMNWDTANNWIAAMNTVNYLGFNDWRLPSALNSDNTSICWGYNCADSELGHLYYTGLGNIAWYDGCTIGIDCGLVNTAPFNNLVAGYYWTNTENASYPSGDPGDIAWGFHMTNGHQNGLRPNNHFALAVRDCDGTCPTPIVPEPISSTLFIIGSATLGLRRRLKAKAES